MDILINILIFIHLVGLVLGLGSGMAMGSVRRAMTDPEMQTGFDKFRSALARNGHVGLAMLWISGPLIIWLRYGGFAGLDFWFWLKMVFVIVLTAALGIGAVNYRKGRQGDAEAARRARLAAMVSGASGLVVIFTAVFAFN